MGVAALFAHLKVLHMLEPTRPGVSQLFAALKIQNPDRPGEQLAQLWEQEFINIINHIRSAEPRRSNELGRLAMRAHDHVTTRSVPGKAGGDDNFMFLAII